MIVENKYMEIVDTSLRNIPSGKPVAVQALVKRTYSIQSTVDTHIIAFEVEFQIMERYMPTKLGTITAKAGATVSGVTRDSPELARKALDIAAALDQFVQSKFKGYAAQVNYDPESLELIPLIQLFTPIMMQNDGIGRVSMNGNVSSFANVTY